MLWSIIRNIFGSKDCSITGFQPVVRKGSSNKIGAVPQAGLCKTFGLGLLFEMATENPKIIRTTFPIIQEKVKKYGKRTQRNLFGQ